MVAGVVLSQSLTTPDEHTAAVNAVLEKLRDQQELVTLRGWYDEVIMIMILITLEPLKKGHPDERPPLSEDPSF